MSTTKVFNQVSQRDYWRIVLALAGKDVIDAIKNKTIVTLIIGLSLSILSVQALPLLLQLDKSPRLAIYDEARSSLADELRADGSARVYEMRSETDALSFAQDASGPALAIILPAGWDESSGPLRLGGYFPHWQADSAGRLSEAEAIFSQATGRAVTIAATPVFPAAVGGGRSGMVSLGLVLIVTLITIMLVPYLLVEEKTSHTLELLQVAPVTATQIVLGKGLAGSLYGFVAGGILIALNLSFVAQWGILLLALSGGTLLGVSIGLLLGLLAENEGTIQLWVGALALLLIFPLLLNLLSENPLPEWGQAIFTWLPTVALFDLFRLAFSDVPFSGQTILKLAPIAATIALIGAVTARRLRQWENG